MSKLAHASNLDYAELYLGAQREFNTTVDEDGGLRLTGICPRCHGETTMYFPVATGDRPAPVTKSLRSQLGQRKLPAFEKPPTMYCECGGTHKRPPTATDNGCGAYWTVVEAK